MSVKVRLWASESEIEQVAGVLRRVLRVTHESGNAADRDGDLMRRYLEVDGTIQQTHDTDQGRRAAAIKALVTLAYDAPEGTDHARMLATIAETLLTRDELQLFAELYNARRERGRYLAAGEGV